MLPVFARYTHHEKRPRTIRPSPRCRRGRDRHRSRARRSDGAQDESVPGGGRPECRGGGAAEQAQVRGVRVLCAAALLLVACDAGGEPPPETGGDAPTTIPIPANEYS